jgi:hypothetical protein
VITYSVKKGDGCISFDKNDIMTTWKSKFKSLYNPPVTQEYDARHYDNIRSAYDSILDDISDDARPDMLNSEIQRQRRGSESSM